MICPQNYADKNKIRLQSKYKLLQNHLIIDLRLQDMFTAKDIYKSYGQIPVVKGVSLRVEKGEIVSITGSSGAGKSTLLHILGTLDAPDKGEVFLNGYALTHLKNNMLASFRNKQLGFVFQFIICCRSLQRLKMFAFQAG